MDLVAFGKELIREFRKIKPVWADPYGLAYKLAKQRKAEITISGMDAAKWKSVGEERLDMPDDRLADMTIRVKGQRGALRLEWIDCRKLVVAE